MRFVSSGLNARPFPCHDTDSRIYFLHDFFAEGKKNSIRCTSETAAAGCADADRQRLASRIIVLTEEVRSLRNLASLGSKERQCRPVSFGKEIQLFIGQRLAEAKTKKTQTILPEFGI